MFALTLVWFGCTESSDPFADEASTDVIWQDSLLVSSSSLSEDWSSSSAMTQPANAVHFAGRYPQGMLIVDSLGFVANASGTWAVICMRSTCRRSDVYFWDSPWISVGSLNGGWEPLFWSNQSYSDSVFNEAAKVFNVSGNQQVVWQGQDPGTEVRSLALRSYLYRSRHGMIRSTSNHLPAGVYELDQADSCRVGDWLIGAGTQSTILRFRGDGTTSKPGFNCQLRSMTLEAMDPKALYWNTQNLMEWRQVNLRGYRPNFHFQNKVIWEDVRIEPTQTHTSAGDTTLQRPMIVMDSIARWSVSRSIFMSAKGDPQLAVRANSGVQFDWYDVRWSGSGWDADSAIQVKKKTVGSWQLGTSTASLDLRDSATSVYFGVRVSSKLERDIDRYPNASQFSLFGVNFSAAVNLPKWSGVDTFKTTMRHPITNQQDTLWNYVRHRKDSIQWLCGQVIVRGQGLCEELP